MTQGEEDGVHQDRSRAVAVDVLLGSECVAGIVFTVGFVRSRPVRIIYFGFFFRGPISPRV